MKCNVCGYENLDNTKFCVNCGASLETKTESYEPIEEFSSINDREKFATPAMVLGILSCSFGVICCLGWISVIGAVICGILALIFSILAWKTRFRGKVVAGLICGIIGLILGLFYLTVFIFQEQLFEFFNNNGYQFPDYYEF